MSPRTFTARFPGRCHADCGNTIEPGDDVVRVDGLLVHDECTGRRDDDWPEEVTLARPRTPDICLTCSLAMPCDCEGATP